jgi:hypothetical protein
VVPADVVSRQLGRLARLGAAPEAIAARLATEGFAAAHVLTTTADLAAVRVERVPAARLP